MKRSPISALATVAIAAVALSACSAASPGDGTASAAPTTFVVSTTINTLDPLLSTTIQNDIVGTLAYDPIVDYDSDGELVPSVATDWQLSDDAMSVELVLRDDIQFSDGTDLTADDVVYTLNRIQQAGTGVAALMPQFVSASADDDTHVTITLSSPNVAFVGALSKVYVLESAVVKEHEGDDLAQSWLAANVAGSGPYTVTGYTQSSEVRLSLNPSYWGDTTGMPTTYVLQYFPESAAAATALRAGTLSMASLPTKDAESFAGDDAYGATEVPSGGAQYVYFNTQKGLTADPRVREAVELAFDYDGFVSESLGGHGEIASQMMPPSLGCDAGLPAPKQDLAEAGRLLEEAGAVGQTLTMLYQPNLPDQVAAATLLQSELAGLGLTIELQTTTFPNYISSLSSIDTTPDLAIASEYPRYPDPDALLNSMLNSRFVEAGSNKSQYANQQVDDLLAAAEQTSDAAVRCDDYTQVEQLVAEDHAIMPVYYSTFQFVTAAGVSGVTASPVHILFDPRSIRVG